MANHLEVTGSNKELSKQLEDYFSDIFKSILPENQRLIIFQTYCKGTNSLRNYGGLDMTLCDSIDCTNCRYIETLLTNDLKTKNESKSTGE